MAHSSDVEDVLGTDDDKETDGAVSPASAVHNTSELLEMILLHLPLPQILTNQRVSKAFRAAIVNSPTIQKTLFFRPSTDYTLQLCGSGLQPSRCASLSTCEISEEKHDEKPRGVIRWTRGEEDKSRYDIVVNPFIKATKHASLNVDFTVPSDARAMQPSATWRSMLLTQPPVLELTVDHWMPCHWHVIRAADVSRGVTLADLEKNMSAFGNAGEPCEEITVAYAEEWDVLSSERSDPRKVLDVPCWELSEQVLAVKIKPKQKNGPLL